VKVAALEYHRLTSYRPGRFGEHDDPRMVQGYRPMQVDRKPPSCKTYPEVPGEPVPEGFADGLFLAAGVVRVKDHPVLGQMLFRAAGSAGNLQPLEVYLVHAGRVLHYEPAAHEVKAVGPAPAGPTAIVVTGVPWRTGWKYTERGFRHLYWDAGTMLSQLLAAFPAGRLHLGFVDDEVAALVGADGVHELPLAVVVLGDDAPALRPVGRAEPGALADAPLEFPVVTGAQRAGALASDEAVAAWRRTEPSPPASTDVTFGLGLGDVVRRRGSTREFAPEATAPPAVLVDAFAAATAPLHADFVDAFAAATAPLHADFVEAGSTLLEHSVVVHAVEGWDHGVYRWSATAGTFDLVAPSEDARALGRHLCLDQDLGGDGVYTAFHGADLEAIVRGPLGDRGYRAAQLEAGIVEGRLHLAAYALGFGATGLTFFDDEVRTACVTSAWPMLVTAVGKPTYRSTAGGDPGRPSVLRA
jgi:hypothetical protein